MPVGIIHGRATTAPVSGVGPRRAAPGRDTTAREEVPGPKLLIDLSLIAPRPTDTPTPKPVSLNLAPPSFDPSQAPELDLLA